MKSLFSFLFHAVEGLTVDLIPQVFSRYYVMNSDKSGFYMPSKHSVLNSETVYYPQDINENVENLRNEFSWSNYKTNVLAALVSHLVATIVVGLANIQNSFVNVLLYVAISVVLWTVVSLVKDVRFVFGNNSVMSHLKHIRIEAGLAEHSGISDSRYALSIKEMLSLSKDSASSSERFERDSKRIKARIFK